MTFLTETSLTELTLLLVAFGLCGLIGIERQIRQKAAGFRTHVLVGTGSAAFTLVSAFGFAGVLGADVNLDPSRIAAQIVSGIGFVGAGVIFTRRDAIRGLTTATTIWVAAAVGMAAGAGMISLAVFLTALHLAALVVFAPIIRRIPGRDNAKVLRITYEDGRGTLREILETAADRGHSALVLANRTTQRDGTPVVEIDLRFSGRRSAPDLLPTMLELPGVRAASSRIDDSLEEDG